MEVRSLYTALKPLANARGTALERAVHYCLHSLMLRLTGMGPAFLIKPSRHAMKVTVFFYWRPGCGNGW